MVVMKSFKLFLPFLLSIFLSLFAKERFTIGTTSGYAPFVSLNDKGEYEGFDIDLAKLVAEKMNRELVIKDLGSMPGLFIGLKQKKVDALIWAISITQERSRQMEMIYYQGERLDTMPLAFWREIPENVEGPEDLMRTLSKAICVEAGSYQEQVLQSYCGARLKNVDKITDALLEIKFGKSIAIALDNSLVALLKEQNPELKVVYFSLPPKMQSMGHGICVSKENQPLAAQIRSAVEELTREGRISALEQKWKVGR